MVLPTGGCIKADGLIGSPGILHNPTPPADSISASARETGPDVPETDPDTIASLWVHVTAMFNRGSKRGGRARGGGASNPSRKRSPSTSIPRTVSELTQSEITPVSIVLTARAITPRSSRFIKAVLHPRGIFVNDTNSIVPTVFSYFDTKKPQEGYNKELSGANVWVVMEDFTSVAAEYKEMRSLSLCKQEFATFAKENFLLCESRSLPVSPDRQWRVQRMLELVCPPKQNVHWRIPLIPDGDTADETDWTWDIQPDCVYWLSLRGFNPEYRFQI